MILTVKASKVDNNKCTLKSQLQEKEILFYTRFAMNEVELSDI